MKLKIILVALLAVAAASPTFAKKPTPVNNNQSTGIPACDQVLVVALNCDLKKAESEKEKNRARKNYEEGRAFFREAYNMGNKELTANHTNFCQSKLVQLKQIGCAATQASSNRKSRPGEDIF